DRKNTEETERTWLLPDSAAAVERPARQGAGVLPRTQYPAAIHPHIADADGELVRLREGRAVGDGGGVEDDHVRTGAGAQEAAVPDAQAVRDGGGHDPHRLLQ